MKAPCARGRRDWRWAGRVPRKTSRHDNVHLPTVDSPASVTQLRRVRATWEKPDSDDHEDVGCSCGHDVDGRKQIMSGRQIHWRNHSSVLAGSSSDDRSLALAILPGSPTAVVSVPSEHTSFVELSNKNRWFFSFCRLAMCTFLPLCYTL
jgi:hypothetical protein